MVLPQTSRWQLAPGLSICRLLNGLGQVADDLKHITPAAAIAGMFSYLDSGYTTWDLADRDGLAEELHGAFRQQLIDRRGLESLQHLQAFTEWAPRPMAMSRHTITENINMAQRRMGVDNLALLQFHWWDHQNSAYLDILKHLADMQAEGKIRHLGLINFDTLHLQRIVDEGIKIISNQVQFSLIDQRPLATMIPFCQQHGIQLLTYGTVCGGLLSEHYLGQAEPLSGQLATVSLKKYKKLIDVWGSWELFQKLLMTLKAIADSQGVSLANVAIRSILDQPTVAGVIVGTDLEKTQHLDDNARVFDLKLQESDHQQIATVLSQAHNLIHRMGDCEDEYHH